MQTKIELRKIAKEIRASLDMENISVRIVQKIRQTEIYQNALHIMIFYPLSHEVNLLSLLGDDKNFYLPKINGEDMLVCPYKNGDETEESSFKTKEPKSAPIDANILDIIFVPALMVDKSRQRLGYGKGFYDKFLSKNAANAVKIVPIPRALIIESIPTDSFDKPVDIVIGED